MPTGDDDDDDSNMAYGESWDTSVDRSAIPAPGTTHQQSAASVTSAGPVKMALKASVTGVDDEDSSDPSTMPYFDYGVPRNVTTVVGQHAFILCRVHRMQDRSLQKPSRNFPSISTNFCYYDEDDLSPTSLSRVLTPHIAAIGSLQSSWTALLLPGADDDAISNNGEKCDIYEVSWVRKRDLHILSAGVYTYTSDQRFVVLHHPEKSENWTLCIRSVQLRDQGTYECQVNTEPKFSMAFHLNVIESRARIIGGSDIHVQSGSSLRLTCEIEHSPHDIAQWYHGSTIIDPQGMYGEAVSGSIQIVTQKSDVLRSQLTIVKVRPNHMGQYTCKGFLDVSASIMVHVISGEHPAERLQRGNRSSSSVTNLRLFEYLLLYASLHLFRIATTLCTQDFVLSLECCR
ncbi:Opioid-binding protein/cell adhesion molecule [Folsomia candida]|uniref:Opioid-binding protein/cell adhesion molecule n=1 Tax=Folsomia candida TaxID=158441 RepID=A0A226EXT6_FOLCA|nr:Opioid-binding protein/cell adhesion molecule [Folsomia candida]